MGIAGIQAEVDASNERQIRFQTFLHYVQGWLENARHSGVTNAATLEAAMQSLPNPGKRSSQTETSVRDHFQRGDLTLRLMKHVVEQGDARLASVASLWLPVQAYYAAHAFGCSALAANNQFVPNNHSASKRAIGEMVQLRFPASLTANVTWDSSSAELVFNNAACTSHGVRDL